MDEIYIILPLFGMYTVKRVSDGMPMGIYHTYGEALREKDNLSTRS